MIFFRPACLIPSALSILFLLTGCNRVFYQPSKRIHGDAAKAGYRFEDHFFRSESGNVLHGRFFPRAEGTVRKGLWIFFHGNSRNLSGSYSLYAWVTQSGWDYFVFDYSGYGKSQGDASREALFRDGQACLGFASGAFPARAREKLVLSGESLGGAVLLASAAHWEDRGRAALIFVDCTFPSYRKVARAVMAERPYAWPFQLLGPALVSDSRSPEKTLGRLKGIPLLVTHCRDDEEIPFRLGKQVFSAASDPKWFWTLDGCGHTQGFTERFPENRRRLLALVDSLPAAGSRDQAAE